MCVGLAHRIFLLLATVETWGVGAQSVSKFTNLKER